MAVYAYIEGEKAPDFELLQKISTLDEQYDRNSAAVAIKLSPDEKHLFVSNAGDNSVAMYDRDTETGLLTQRSVLPISGDYPKDIAIFPDDKHLVSLNHETNEMTFFALDYEKGIIVMNGAPRRVETGNCCIITKLP